MEARDIFKANETRRDALLRMKAEQGRALERSMDATEARIALRKVNDGSGRWPNETAHRLAIAEADLRKLEDVYTTRADKIEDHIVVLDSIDDDTYVQMVKAALGAAAFLTIDLPVGDNADDDISTAYL
jgi:uncharacterized protein (DUF2336 family)